MESKTNNLLRKVIKKDYSHLISLPLFWLQIVGLEASDYVELSMGKENQLIVKPHKKEEEEESR
jgi:antitoxin component of MazEF toxin-antitoxin module